MSFTDEQTTSIERWLSANWSEAKCPAGHDDWSVADTMSFIPGFVSDEKGSRIAHEAGGTFVLLTCGQCGYVAFLNSRVLGLTG